MKDTRCTKGYLYPNTEFIYPFIYLFIQYPPSYISKWWLGSPAVASPGWPRYQLSDVGQTCWLSLSSPAHSTQKEETFQWDVFCASFCYQSTKPIHETALGSTFSKYLEHCYSFGTSLKLYKLAKVWSGKQVIWLALALQIKFYFCYFPPILFTRHLH